MRYISPSIFFTLLTLGAVFLFFYHCSLAFRSDLPGLQWVRGQFHPLSFAGTLHPMEKSDRLPILLITFLYAFTAFFQLGSTSAPQKFYDFYDKQPLTIAVSGTPVQASGIRYYTGLGTGAYNVETSPDGEQWYTLWQRKDNPDDPEEITGYYWADAEGYSPSYALTQKYNQLFKWIDLTLDNPMDIQYLRLTGRPDRSQQVLELGKLVLLDEEGQVILFNFGLADGSPMKKGEDWLFMVTTDVEEKPTWHNSTYFDEIYHARTAKEHIDGLYPYEVTHPPLGKLILALGIRLFGMTPFGWRFMGTLFGVLMLPILYIFLKNMFGKTAVASCGTILFAVDFMHLTQTRIATIDTYAVFFILCMYFFMYRYLTLPAGTPFWKGALPLFLSGLSWGLGAAGKWTVFYAGVGLAIVYFMGFYQKLRDWPGEGEDTPAAGKAGWVVKTLLFSVLCFVILPFVIYCASYLPYAWAREVDLSWNTTWEGMKTSFPLLFQNLWRKLTLSPEEFQAAAIPVDSLPGIVANNQWYMFTYHQGVHSAHPYSSWWFQWIVNGRPILYYMDNTVAGYTTRFAAFANPVVCWAGLGAILICAARSFRRMGSKLAFLFGLGFFAAFFTWRAGRVENGVFDPALPRETLICNGLLLLICLLLYLVLCVLAARFFPGCSSRCAFLLVAFLSQLLPWMLVSRITFAYHYFPSILFLTMAIACLFHALIERCSDWRWPVYGLTGFAVGLYALFYPVLIGLTIPTWYEPLVKWLESWPF